MPEPADNYSPPKLISELATWKIGQLSNYARNVVSKAMGSSGVKRHHVTVLATLDESGPLSQAELSRRLWIDPSDLHAVLNDLERDELVERVPDQNDRRRNLVELRKPGSVLLKKIMADVQAAQQELLEPLNPEQQSEFNSLLGKVLQYHDALHPHR